MISTGKSSFPKGDRRLWLHSAGFENSMILVLIKNSERWAITKYQPLNRHIQTYFYFRLFFFFSWMTVPNEKSMRGKNTTELPWPQGHKDFLYLRTTERNKETLWSQLMIFPSLTKETMCSSHGWSPPVFPQNPLAAPAKRGLWQMPLANGPHFCLRDFTER